MNTENTIKVNGYKVFMDIPVPGELADVIVK